MQTHTITSFPEIPSINDKLSYSTAQVEAGIIMAENRQRAESMAHFLKLQETHGPLGLAKDLLVLSPSLDLVFCGDIANPNHKEAYAAVYFYTAGWFDSKESSMD